MWPRPVVLAPLEPLPRQPWLSKLRLLPCDESLQSSSEIQLQRPATLSRRSIQGFSGPSATAEAPGEHVVVEPWFTLPRVARPKRYQRRSLSGNHHDSYLT